MVFLPATFSTQTLFHTQCVYMFIAYLLIKFHLSTTNCLLTIATKPKYNHICEFQITIVHLTKVTLKAEYFLLLTP
jgi:hypothetical protein